MTSEINGYQVSSMKQLSADQHGGEEVRVKEEPEDASSSSYVIMNPIHSRSFDHKPQIQRDVGIENESAAPKRAFIAIFHQSANGGQPKLQYCPIEDVSFSSRNQETKSSTFDSSLQQGAGHNVCSITHSVNNSPPDKVTLHFGSYSGRILGDHAAAFASSSAWGICVCHEGRSVFYGKASKSSLWKKWLMDSGQSQLVFSYKNDVHYENLCELKIPLDELMRFKNLFDAVAKIMLVPLGIQNRKPYLSKRTTKNKNLSLADKMKAIEAYDRLKSARKVAESFGISKDQVCRLVKRKCEVINTFQNSPALDRKRLRVNSTGNDKVNEATLQWFRNLSATGCSPTGPMIQARAREFASSLGKESFKASNGWLGSFLKRNGIILGSVNKELSISDDFQEIQVPSLMPESNEEKIEDVGALIVAESPEGDAVLPKIEVVVAESPEVDAVLPKIEDVVAESPEGDAVLPKIEVVVAESPEGDVVLPKISDSLGLDPVLPKKVPSFEYVDEMLDSIVNFARHHQSFTCLDLVYQLKIETQKLKNVPQDPSSSA